MRRLSPKLCTYFEEYDAFHRHPVNRLTHSIAIPLIVFHCVAMLNWVPVFVLPGVKLTLAHLGFVFVIGWYATLDWRLSLIMALLYAACFAMAVLTPMWLVVSIAVLGWTIQLAGHVVWEKRQPAFFTNLLQALIGPLYFVARLVGIWPQRF